MPLDSCTYNINRFFLPPSLPPSPVMTVKRNYGRYRGHARGTTPATAGPGRTADDSCARVHPLVLSTTTRGPETRARHPSSWTAASSTFASNRVRRPGLPVRTTMPISAVIFKLTPDMLPMWDSMTGHVVFGFFVRYTRENRRRLTSGGGKGKYHGV